MKEEDEEEEGEVKMTTMTVTALMTRMVKTRMSSNDEDAGEIVL